MKKMAFFLLSVTGLHAVISNNSPKKETKPSKLKRRVFSLRSDREFLQVYISQLEGCLDTLLSDSNIQNTLLKDEALIKKIKKQPELDPIKRLIHNMAKQKKGKNKKTVKLLSLTLTGDPPEKSNKRRNK